MARIRIGTSGYLYPHWRGRFYPDKLPARRWLGYLSQRLDSVELNSTFYSLKSPDVFRKWAEETPDPFLLAIKGSRFITHNLKLRHLTAAMGNFLASGPLALGDKTGPFLWQLPATYAFEAGRIDRFLADLPRDTEQAARLAERHDERLKRGALTKAERRLPLRHALEVRHPSYGCDEFLELLRRHGVALVIADTAGRFPYLEQVTADFVYVRLHGSRQLYVSRYSDHELAAWAEKLDGWRCRGLDCYVYFDNDAEAHAPVDALRLKELLQVAVS